MDPRLERGLNLTRRQFLGRAGVGIGTAALAELLNQDLLAQTMKGEATGALPGLPHFAPKAKRVIYLFQGGGPSQLDLWDYKPALEKLRATELPDSVRNGDHRYDLPLRPGPRPPRPLDPVRTRISGGSPG